MKIGEVEKVNWYVLDAGDSETTTVSFHVAYFDKAREKSVVFYSDKDTFAGRTAERMGLKYTFIRNATAEEAEKLIDAKGYRVLSVLNV